MSEPSSESRTPEWRVRRYRVIEGRRILFDAENFLWQFRDWSEEVVKLLAEEVGLTTLSPAHWKVIRFFRDFYSYHGHAPLNKELTKGTGMTLLEIEKLFPGGIKQGARRLAGLPNPKSCGS